MSAIADILDRAADLIEPEGAWTQGVPGKTADGFPLHGPEELAREAVCFCAIGAIRASAPQDASWDVEMALARAINYRSIVGWNDAPERTQAEVVAAFREAAALARGEQP